MHRRDDNLRLAPDSGLLDTRSQSITLEVGEVLLRIRDVGDVHTVIGERRHMELRALPEGILYMVIVTAIALAFL